MDIQPQNKHFFYLAIRKIFVLLHKPALMIKRISGRIFGLLPKWAWVGICVILVAGSAAAFQNYQAARVLHDAQNLDKAGQYSLAASRLRAIKLFVVWPNLVNQIRAEQHHSQQLLAVAQKLQEVSQLLKEHKTQAAQDLLKSLGKDSATATTNLQAQITQLQKSAQTQAASNATAAKSSSPTTHTTAGGSTGGGTTSGGGGGSTSGGGNTTQNGITYLTTCPGTVTTGGSYVLTTNLTQTTPTTACINANGVSGISIDCGGHSIIIAAGPAPISLLSSPNFTIKNCNLASSIGTNLSNNGTITGNTFAVSRGAGLSIILGGNGYTFTNNTITNGVLLLYSVSNNTVSGNTLVADPSVTPTGVSGVIEVHNATGNTISNNHIDGGFHGSLGQQGPGSDDGIMLLNTSSSYITGNTIQNVFDCGIETTSQTTNDHFLNNTISNAAYCGIGGWYWNSWLNNVVQGNIISGTKLIFQLFVDTNYPIGGNGPSTFYFQGNQFISNQFTSGTASNTSSANMNFAQQYLPSGVTATTGNNQFQDNNFGKFDLGPNLLPQSAIVDLGGNICSPSTSLTCN